MSTQQHSVVIVGGGVGGLRAATLLSRDSRYDVTLISKKRTFDHHTSLHRNKKGRSRRHISLPLQHVFKGRRIDLDLVRAEMSTLDPQARKVISTDGIEYAYDGLIVALEGESRELPGIDADVSYNAYSASRMNALRRRLISEVESGEVYKNYAVVGAGESGVEMAYELHQLLRGLIKFYGKQVEAPNIVLVEESSRVLPLAAPSVSRRVEKKLRKKGIQVLLGSQVSSYQGGLLHMSDGRTIDTPIVISAAGTRANHFFADNSEIFLLDENRFVRTTDILEAEGFNNIYVIGNSKSSEERLNTTGKLYDAKYVTTIMDCKQTGKEIPRYDPPQYEVRMQLGHGWAVYQTAQRTYWGFLGWTRKRWLDRALFSTLLPRRLWFRVWLFGSQHDEIQ